MLPSKLCGIGQCLRAYLLSRERAANLPQDKVRMLPEGLEVAMDILQQGRKGGPLMVVRDLSSRPAPEPFDPIGVRVVGGRINDPQVVVQLGHHLTHQFRPCRGMGAQIVDKDNGVPPSGSRPRDGSADLGAKNISGPAWSQAAVKPALTPIDEAEAINFVVGPGRLDEALPASAFTTPDAGQGRMERELDLILEIEIGAWQEAQQFFKVWWHFSEEVGLDQRGHGWRGWRASPGQHHLHPQAFPT